MYSGIRPAERRDIHVLCGIWQACFYDQAEYIRFFYEENFDRIAVYVRTVNDSPVSMLHLLDSEFANGPAHRMAKLIYAAGTDPAYRKNGYMSELIRYAASLAKSGGYALFLKPSSEHLAEYYGAFGFTPDAHFRLLTVPPGDRIPLSLTDLSPEEYNRLRDAAFSTRPYARWEDDHLRWCVAENAFCGGRTVAVEMDGGTRFFMGYPRDGVFLITETDMTPSQLRRAGGTLCGIFGTGALRAYLPDFACDEGELIVSSVVYNAPTEGTYVNLILI